MQGISLLGNSKSSAAENINFVWFTKVQYGPRQLTSSCLKSCFLNNFIVPFIFSGIDKRFDYINVP